MIRVGDAANAPDFPVAAKCALANAQLRRNVRHATDVIRGKRAIVVGEMADWEAAARIGARRSRNTRSPPRFLSRAVRAELHARRRAGALGARRGRGQPDRHRHHPGGTASTEVIKVKTMTSDETRLNEALEAAGHRAVRDRSRRSDHPARQRSAVAHRRSGAASQPHRDPRASSARRWSCGRSATEPEDLAAAARQFLREKFLRVKVGFSGANFAIADTGSVCVVESEGNGRMCVTLPRVLITLVGIEKVIPRFQDLEVFLQLLPRSATGERMNPYNSIWTGVTRR